MLRLDIKREPYWLDLVADIRLYVRPLTHALMAAVQNHVITEMRAKRRHVKNSKPFPIDELSVERGESEALLITTLARVAILDWKNVLDAETDTPAPLNDQTVTDLMEIWYVADDFWRKYTAPLLALEQEGNVSRPVAAGTSVAEPHTAASATKPKHPAVTTK